MRGGQLLLLRSQVVLSIDVVDRAHTPIERMLDAERALKRAREAGAAYSAMRAEASSKAIPVGDAEGHATRQRGSRQRQAPSIARRGP